MCQGGDVLFFILRTPLSILSPEACEIINIMVLELRRLPQILLGLLRTKTTVPILWWWWQRNSELPQAGFPESGEVYLTVLSQPLALATIRLLLPAEPLRLLLRRSRETREREREI